MNSIPKVSLARALSKLGYCSRTLARKLILEGRVRVNGSVHRNPNDRLDLDSDRIEVDGRRIHSSKKIYLAFHKPKGIVTTRSDEKGRKTVYDCLPPGAFPWLFPVGRLDKASEGLLLLTNDTQWAAAIADPESHLEKIYHVQVKGLPDPLLPERMEEGREIPEGDFLRVKRARWLRLGKRSGWLEVTLEEGKNRHIRRLLKALGIEVRRLVRVAIGSVKLGDLAKGAYRPLSEAERRALS